MQTIDGNLQQLLIDDATQGDVIFLLTVFKDEQDRGVVASCPLLKNGTPQQIANGLRSFADHLEETAATNDN